CLFGLAAVSLFPRLIPSSINLAYSLTIYNASSTGRTLTVMLVIAIIGMPLVIGYTVYIYRVFKGKVVITDSSY
ncbi:cytochrome D oxidase subunit I, partial [bacterium SM23_31]